jgi:hypothetical protein
VLLAGLALGAAVLFAARGRSFSRAASWLALTIVGWSAALHLTDAPPVVAYQHYRLGIAGLADWAAWALLAAQAAILVTAGRRHLSWLIGVARDHPVAAAAVLGFMALTSAAPSQPVQRSVTELLAATAIGLTALGCVVAAARSLPESPALAAATARILGAQDAPGPTRVDRWVMAVAGIVVAIAGVLAWAAYDRHPHVPDEVAYLIHARYLAGGALWMSPAAVPAAFHLDLLHYEPARWFSPVPPGWPAVLALGVSAGIPWLVNPLLGGVAIVLAYLLFGALFDRRTTRLATLLLALSPWFLFMAMNFMTHTLSLVCALAAALGVARARSSGRAMPAFVGGLAVGAVSLVRPLEGVIVAALLGLWSLAARGRAWRFSPSAALVAGTVLSGALVFPYNQALTGSAGRFPINAYIDKYYAPGANDLGFGPGKGLAFGGNDPFPGHGPVDVVVNSAFNMFAVNVELLGWPTGAAVLLALAVVVGARKLGKADWWQLAVIAAIAGTHALYWFSGGPDFGARYWYLAIVPCVVLVARALRRLRWTRAPASASVLDEDRTMIVALGLTACALALVIPWKSAEKYHNYRGMRADIRELPPARAGSPALVLVRGRRFPDYASAAAYNPLDLRSGVVYAWDASPEIREQVVRAYRDRPIWFVDGPSLSRGGFRVVAGPLSGDAVLSSPPVPVDVAGGESKVYDPVYPPSLPLPP